MNVDFPELQRIVDRLETSTERVSGQEAEHLLMDVLRPLLHNDGYVVTYVSGRTEENGFDFLARRAASPEFAATAIGIEYKHLRAPVAVASVRQLLGAAVGRAINRVMLISNSGFTKQAKREVARDLPVIAELIDLQELKEWIRRGTLFPDGPGSPVEDLIREVSRRFAQLVARDPTQLDHLEWRDMERLVAEVFRGLGFSVTLTPSSKDGGKDVILECCVDGLKKSYVVEIKHWRSSTRVGNSAVTSFIEVVARERRDGGVFLSTYGYCDNAFSTLSEIDRERVRFGDKTKVIAMCRTYTKAQSGIWSPPAALVELLYDGTE
jgi:restriction system protein